jgi:hypothetical protein
MKLKGWFGFDSTFDLRTLAFSMHLESGSGVKKDTFLGSKEVS